MQDNIRVEILSGLYSGRVFLRKLPLLIGRGLVESENVLDLADYDESQTVSQNHAEIVSENGRYFLIDLGSRNGTFVFSSGKLEQLDPNVKFEVSSKDIFVVGEFLLRLLVERSQDV
ncbi:MAG: FHA domain-containing protein [Deltaproteobacteria bacterium]|nr:FHA domain-containing protein [Deltaproteobacteria bacterium]